jgi:2-polyprenyl-3-methyl-5-hydroxy-6-metoxy-1,4-benzoquinol methylase
VPGVAQIDPKPLARERSRNRPAYAGVDAMNEPAQAPAVAADCHGKRIGILIVAYNAVTTIAEVLKRIPADVWRNVEEVVIFDDASRDHTYELAQGLKMLSGLEKLSVIKNRANLGYGGNQKLGYRYFLDKGFDVVVLLHGDGQYAPEMLAHLYAPIVAGAADAVFGSRMMKDYGGPLKGGMPLYKYVGNRILTHFENRALGMSLSEFHSGYRAYSLAALAKIDFSHMTDVFHFDTQIIIKLHHQGYRIVEVPIPTYYGTEICYVNGLNYAKDVFASIIRYARTKSSVASYPEYAEYFQHYPLKRSRNSSYQYFLSWIGRQHRVLDIGCGEGFFAQEVVQAGNSVVGIDALESPTNLHLLDSYIRANLENGLSEAGGRLEQSRFDRILLQDVLEHVADPERLLKDAGRYLEPAGLLLISVPNVANITVRLALFFGRFEYRERGILDRTHLRFFTRRTARRLIEKAGFAIVREQATVMPVELALGLRPEHPLMRAANAVLAIGTRLLPKLLGYQLLFAVRPVRPLAPVTPEGSKPRYEPSVVTQ